MSFPSEEFYKKLDKELPHNILIYKKYCVNVDSLESDSRYMETCYKVVRFLTVNEYENNKKISCNHCKLLNYWIFDQIKRISEKDTTKIYVAYPYIGFVMNNIMDKFYGSNKSQCTFDYNVPHDPYWKTKKEFYEYCLDYNEINEKKHLTDYECKKYRDYLKTKTDLLANFKEILTGNKYKKCSNSDGETGACDTSVILDELSKINDTSEARNDLTDESSKLFLGLSKKNTATAASVAGVSLLGLTLFKVKKNFIYQFEYQIGLLILCYH
ncbi:VIR protein [Plasmodium vivax]|uniref:VIR protein n=1 Tax=Plasmodium vivax TaxID=5855 RepID=A0A1G4ECT1_PLAVI|nr:VIR protein [Plasmodium vivax]